MLFSDLAISSYGTLTAAKEDLESLLNLEKLKTQDLTSEHNHLTTECIKLCSQVIAATEEVKLAQVRAREAESESQA